MTTEPLTQPADDPRPPRDQALWPYLEKLRIWSEIQAESAGSGLDVEFRVGEHAVLVESWESGQLRAGFRAEEAGDAPSETARLTTTALALVTKILSDIEELRLAVENHDRVFRAQAELMLDAAMGRALTQEIQSETERQVRDGRVEVAKSLTDLRHKVKRAADIARSRIADAEQRVAALRGPGPAPGVADAADAADASGAAGAQAAEAGTGAAVRVDRELLVEADPAEELREAHRRERERRLAEELRRRERLRAMLPSRTGTLALAFAMVASAWFGLAWLPHQRAAELRLPAIGAQAFQYRTAKLFEAVRPFPPSLYITMRESTWEGLSRLEQEQVLDEAARVVSVRGYRGVLISGETGRPLGQWLRERGALILPRGEEPDGRSPAPP